ncbi:hypothetical protein FOCC_FOCC011990 [Frankliniella occidentalis]|uniref:Integrin beta n=1 Tax=Frankliniella occidentalis TaxID=133901 RepID=A0A6J1SLM1_FRAOC|nr:integrin beta-PS isoform X3 [Frankliniella occidentalis]KAE8742436.1 hypothetical protein FOCC_FOCC011990 [Frankliniella occidentalis]
MDMILRINSRKTGMSVQWVVVVTCLLASILSISAQSGSRQISEKLAQNPCSSKQTCHECIQTSTCAWCAQPDFGDRKRCFQPSNQDSNRQCNEAYMIFPQNEYTVERNEELSKASKGSGYISGSSYQSSSHQESGSAYDGGFKEAVQVAPQQVSLKLRINEKYRLNVNYAQAEDYPVDLYYLMDLSKSMEDDKEKLSSLGNLLAQAMQNITSNFRLGFGSFVDKTVMPYVSTVPKKLAQPCDNCQAPYGFRNHMKLNSNTQDFSEEVRNAAVSGNLDAPEGGFDAIMQAVVCREQIGWREKARRLLVFSTDAGFHYAGDGKLGGIVKPNDGLCHMDTRGMYTHSSIQDYPSISQINLQVKRNAINVIFAVTAEQIAVYDRLREHVEGASAGTLSNDSANVVELVRDQYNKISSSVEMKDNATSAVKVTYYSSCLEDGGPLKQTNKCDGLKVGTLVKFAADIEVTSCPANRDEWKQTFQIYPVGINESLVIDLEMICDCACENPGNVGYIENAKECSGFGTYKCGVCECDSSHFGRTCECDSDNTHSDRDQAAGCRPDNTTTVDCSGRGSCVCGMCDCETRPNPEEKIYGSFCECDNFSCDRQGGQLCSGEDHGKCECGKCQCLPGWTGLACDCKATNETCIPPNGGEVCSGKGECVCGTCKCFEGEEGRYSGRYCEKCPTCPGRCLEFKECVQCMVYKTGKLSEEECARNCTFVPRVIDVVEADEEKDENLCAYYDEDDCRFAYVYTYDENGKVEIRAQQERECPPQVYIPGIVLGVIGAIVLIGLAMLLLWKLLTTIHDRREFAKFEKERSMARWNAGENPIYKQATSTFKNPTYAGK